MSATTEQVNAIADELLDMLASEADSGSQNAEAVSLSALTIERDGWRETVRVALAAHAVQQPNRDAMRRAIEGTEVWRVFGFNIEPVLDAVLAALAVPATGEGGKPEAAPTLSEVPDGVIPWEFFAEAAGWVKPEAAPSDTDREALKVALTDGYWERTGYRVSWQNIGALMDAILAAGFSRTSQPVQVEPWSAENLQIVNGWLVERGANPLDYPAGAAYGAMPYSDAEPLVNLSELQGWPVQVEVTDDKTTMSDHSGPGHSAGDPGYCAGCYEDMIANARKRADELIEESHGPDGGSPGNSVLDEDAELLVALADALGATRKVEVTDELRKRIADEVGYPAQADDYYGPEGEEFAEGQAKGYNAAFENVLAALGGGDHAE